jgi:hypothetical protein
MFYRKQILFFVKRALNGEKRFVVPAKVKFVSVLGPSTPCQTEIFFNRGEIPPKTVVFNLSLNRKYFTLEPDRNILKAYLLHELGHCFFPFEFRTSRSELYAHIWAIKKSRKMGLTKVTPVLENIIDEWKTMNWNRKKDRIYIKAGRTYDRLRHSGRQIRI